MTRLSDNYSNIRRTQNKEYVLLFILGWKFYPYFEYAYSKYWVKQLIYIQNWVILTQRKKCTFLLLLFTIDTANIVVAHALRKLLF